MPRTISLAEVAQMDPGESVPQTKGTVKAVFERKTGKNSNGPWSLQNFVLQDGPTEIKVCLSGRPANEIDSLKGKQVWLMSNKSEKHGLTGVKIEENKWTDKSGKEHNDKIIKVTPSAVIARSDTPEPSEPSDNDGYNVDPEPPDDDQVPGAEVAPKAPPTAKPVTHSAPLPGVRCKSVEYSRTVNTGNYCNVKVGIVLELSDGAKFQDALNAAKAQVEKNLPVEGTSR